ncbi:hypothetical protein Y88_1009 [Novosphingobium nitrogenifigens DSM 19370]|uniref:Methanolan biosynthesis EpsI domain-containing protein n=1 Tax=Novosphingobium nitrogenifigens DSM 19370 TaxID=983920 RepID=F1Z933_9SPHN|nr:hypothetical protein Y88_1009 [Novosphingobium nitrogenifigens DSM 19370]
MSPLWRGALARLALSWAMLGLLFFGDWRDMVGQWWGSSTYNHILLVPPILAWLVAQRREEVLRLSPQTWWPGLVVFAGAGFFWLLGDFAGLSLARQLGVVVMAQASLAVVMGPEVVAGLLFPLFYMLFLVPVGDEMIPFLQTLTAKITMIFLGMAHIPAAIDGVFITTPAGYFEVAEACSGVKFLIAMIAYGALVANVCFLRWQRRAAFMAVSLVVPVLANGARAFGTIWIAGWYGIAFASGFDHVFYGWVFFAVVMGLCMAVGWRFFDRPIHAPMINPEAIARCPLVCRLKAFSTGPMVGLGLLVTIAGLFLGWGAMAEALAAPLPERLGAPTVPGWQRVAPAGGSVWLPLHGGADRRLRLTYRNAAGQAVDVSFALYDRQGEGREAGGFGQGALPPNTRWAWERAGPAFGTGKSDIVQAPGPEHRWCVTWYRSGELLNGSNLALRLHVMADHLLLRRRATSTLIVSASDRGAADPVVAIRAFLAATGPVDAWMDHLSGQR